MASLTPLKDAESTVYAAMKTGFISGGLAAIPSSLAVYVALNYSPKFVKGTNWQSRTAMIIMPPFFAFAFSSEQKLVHSMQEMASVADHSKKMAEWTHENASNQHKARLHRMSTQQILSQPGITTEGNLAAPDEKDHEEREKKILQRFRDSVLDSGVRVVSGDSLGVQHKVANFWQENPFKILAGIGVPAVLYIFKGRASQKHLATQMKVIQTRVIGQFTVIIMLLTLMGFKEYMDSQGKYITEGDVQARIAQMQQSRNELSMRLQRDRMQVEQIAEKRRQAHEVDMLKSGKVSVLKSGEVKNALKDA